ncbi:GNAT superfamily N-acetyltransferase [Paenibacillus sp. DS2015]|uniref:GNAT family N-acetyltransferase n=1 Tax=Paenibacillus sp. DS2015 TaxID=3373917 RepID=UPI003D1C37E3
MIFRLIQDHELGQAVTLVEDVFCTEGDRYMESSFPSLFRPGISHSYGAFDEQGKIVSFMGMVPVMIKSLNASLFAFSMGAVCTDPQYRGQGIASKLLDLCQQHAREAGASLLFISGERSLYTRVGSVHFGKSRKFVIDADMTYGLTQGSLPWKIRDMEPTDIFTIHALLHRQSAAIQWGISDLQQAICAQPVANIQRQDQHIFVAESTNQEPAAFVVLAISKSHEGGEEPIGTVVEWAGTSAAVIALLSHSIRQFHLSSLTLMVTWEQTELADLLDHAGVKPTSYESNAGTVLVVDGATLISQVGLDRTSDQNMNIAVLPDGSYELTTLDSVTTIANEAELCSLLFDPDSPITTSGNTKVKTLPLPYMYGLYFI